MIAAIDAGDEMPAGDDSALIDALLPGPKGPPRRLPMRPPTVRARRFAAPRTIRLSVELLESCDEHRFRHGAGRIELARRLRESDTDVPVDGAFERLSSIHRRNARPQSPAPACSGSRTCSSGLPRMVRDLSAELGKQVLVDIEGGDVELDRENDRNDPRSLNHIVRNAVDHGIETPASASSQASAKSACCRSRAPVGQPDPDRHSRRRPRH